MEDPDRSRFQKAQRVFGALAECLHGGFSLYCDLCRDPDNILKSRTRRGKFGDSVAELQRVGLLDGVEVYEPKRAVHKRITASRLIKIGAFLLGGVLVYETLRRGKDLKGIVLHFIKKGETSP